MTDWRADARCAGMSIHIFFPVGVQSLGRGRVRDEPAIYAVAKSVCAQCPVATQCAQFAAVNLEPYGMFGGLRPSERRKQRRENPPAARCANCGRFFPRNRRDRRFCSPGCAAAHKARQPKRTKR